MRIIGWNVQPVVMIDDGENLVPVNVAPQQIVLSMWEQFKNGGDEVALAQVREQIEFQLSAAGTSPTNGNGGQRHNGAPVTGNDFGAGPTQGASAA